jgi:hypothetical protein
MPKQKRLPIGFQSTHSQNDVSKNRFNIESSNKDFSRKPKKEVQISFSWHKPYSNEVL